MAENEETSNDSSVRHFETITVKVEIVESDLAQEMDFQDSNTEADDPDKNIENASSAGQPQKPNVELEVDEDGAVEGVDDDDDDLDWDQNQGVRRGKRLRSKRKLMRSPGQQSLLCELCDYSTRHHASLQRHTISQHKVKEPSNLPTYDCTECPYKSIFKSNLAAHRRKHSMEKKFKCGLCEFSTAYKHNFLKHSKVHTNKEETAYKCDKCPFVTKYEGHITRHLAKIHNEVSEKASKCDNCSFTTKVKWRLNVHRNRSRQNSPIKCEHCDFSSLFTCEFKTHKAVHRGLAPKYRDTNTFNQTLNTVKPLDTCLHVESPSNTNQDIGLPFNITGDVTDQESIREFEPHLEYSKTNRYLIDTNCEINWKDIPVKELQGMQRMFKCTVCSYKSKFKASIQRHHYRRHTENKNRPYKCINCDFATKTKDKISLHVKRSQSTVPLKCNSCPFVTHFKCQQIQHQKMHNMFKCLFCQFTCKNNTELQRHNGNSHFGEGIKCKFCDYRAPRKESIICHEWIHTGIKPFRCDHCEYSCMRRRLLEAHVNKNHCVKKDEVVYISDSKIQKLRVDNKSEPVLENNAVWIATEDHGDSNSGS